jgi:beta-phosphoglucomutase
MYLQPESLIFDFDGVLADTEPLYWRAWVELLRPHGIVLSWEQYCRVGRGVKDEEMLPRIPQVVSNPALLARLKEKLVSRREMVQRWATEQTQISEATAQLLHSLSAFQLGLVTSSHRADVEPMLRAAGVAECFEATVFGDEVTQHKPHPAPYLQIREKLGVPEALDRR